MRANYGMMAAAVAALGAVSGVPIEDARQVSRSQPIYRHPKNTKLNRSNKWPHAKTYAEARAMSPFPNRVIR